MALVSPGHPWQASQGAFRHRLAAIDGLEVENLLLDVRGEQREIQQLAQPSSGEAEQARYGSLVDKLTGLNCLSHVVRQGKHARYVGRLTRDDARRWWWRSKGHHASERGARGRGCPITRHRRPRLG
jgi:hypothetical protein